MDATLSSISFSCRCGSGDWAVNIFTFVVDFLHTFSNGHCISSVSSLFPSLVLSFPLDNYHENPGDLTAFQLSTLLHFCHDHTLPAHDDDTFYRHSAPLADARSLSLSFSLSLSLFLIVVSL